MRYQTCKSSIQVIGKIWMPAVTAYEYPLSSYDLENIGELTRENCEAWLATHSGDFQSIEDFRVDISTRNGVDFVSEWANEESEFIFSDCMYPVEN